MITIVVLSLALSLSTEREVKFVGAGGFELVGTLSIPADTKGKVPGVLLLPGSGPTDRDGNQPPGFNTNLLKQIAGRLSQEGFASLRFDKRAAHVYAGKWPLDVASQNDFFSWEMFVGDAKAALAFLRAQAEVDPKRTIIAGHSEGSSIAMQIAFDTAGKQDAPAGLILMGAPGRNLGEVLREQVAAGLKRQGLTDAMAQVYNDYMDKAIKQIAANATLPKDPAPTGIAGLFPLNAMKLLQSYFTIDPAAQLKTFGGPVLIVQGEKDIQIRATKDTPMLERALNQRKSGTAQIFIVPSASHNLKKVGDENKEPGLEGPVVPEALDKIAGWMKSMFANP